MKLYAAALNFRPIAEEFSVPTSFSDSLHQAAAHTTDAFADQRTDYRAIEFVTIDPVGSMDLDQAVAITALTDGYRVYYAIADVAAFIHPGSELEAESIRRGQTIYLPDEPARLHPEEISEGAASLLPNVDRPAVVWTIDLDAQGEVRTYAVERALVRSRARLDYEGVQRDVDNGTLHPSIALLPKVGRRRQASALRRSAVNLRLPAQRVERLEDGTYELELEPRLPVMEWNSEISLLTGMIAGQMMAKAQRGILRTLGPADEKSMRAFVTEAQAFGYRYDGRTPVGEFLASVDVTEVRGMAIMREAQKLLRGSGYVYFGPGATAPSEQDTHAGVGGYYAHVTAPLRRLADRYATEVCLALHSGREIPTWVDTKGAEIVAAMERTTTLASNVDRACLRLTEATVLAPHIGKAFDALILNTEVEKDSCRIFVTAPPLLCGCSGAPQEGTKQPVRLVDTDVDKRTVSFAWPA
ncbi:RNB domain-containing ribonuclease [Corynebacterium epidermidicanis]|uniref:RNB domain n=1 Tax=Corynebacterium epidermidicanis TaxID=1050174 RepID=A0A0G3GQW3_9CORY|nr:RNB domain-containing ribonuclease [Corynebacterium epidermidicanis]AKK03596.1 RNB domain [Corynebacterium epidermidicanis]